MLQQYSVVMTGELLTLECEPERRLDDQSVTADAPDGCTIVDATGRTLHLAPGRYTLKPVTHGRGWAWFAVLPPGCLSLDSIKHYKGGRTIEQLEQRAFWLEAHPELHTPWYATGERPRLHYGHDGAALLPIFDEGDIPHGRCVDYCIRHGKQGHPFSYSLPRRNPAEGTPDTLDGEPVLRYPDGGYSDMHGKPAVRNQADYRRERDRTGMERD